MQFKRKVTTLEGGEYENMSRRGTDYLDRQPVRIIACTGEDEDGEDLYTVETYGTKPERFSVPRSALHPMPDEPATNVEFVTHLMENSRSGVLMQLFIIDAIGKLGDRIASNPDTVREQMANGFVNPDAWIETATEALAALESRKA